MPAAEFSEFSYGYAVAHEAEELLTTLGAGLVSAPTLPSLIKENTVGFDAHLVSIDFALFLQFKRSFFVSRQHTSGPCGYLGHEPHCTWAFWKTEHYRFDVDMSSNQFHAMRGYETDIALAYRAGLSLYAAPAFHLEVDLNLAYARRAILDRSVAVLPSAFDGAPPPGTHKYSFLPTMAASVITSEAIEATSSTLRNSITAAVQPVLADPSGDALTLAALGSWAAGRAAEGQLSIDFDRDSAPDTLAFLNDFAALMGGAFVLLGRIESGESSD